MTTTLEAFADTLIPGREAARRRLGDRGCGARARCCAGRRGRSHVVPGSRHRAGAAGSRGVLNSRARRRTPASTSGMPDPTLPPFVALSFADRTRLLLELLDPTRAGLPRLVGAGGDAVPRLPHRRSPAHRRRRPARASRAGGGSASRSRTPTACGASRTSPTGASWRTRIPRTTSNGNPHDARSSETDRRPRHRQRLRRRDPGVPPRRRRREGRGARTRAVAGREEFDHDFQLGSYTQLFDFVSGDGMSVLAGNCVGGVSVVYFAACARAPSFVFERQRQHRPADVAAPRSPATPWTRGTTGSKRRCRSPSRPGTTSRTPAACSRRACHHAGRTCNPVPVAVDLAQCTNCNWMLSGCRFDAKRSMLLNYLPAALAHGAEIRPLHEVQRSRRPRRRTATGSTTPTSTTRTTGVLTGGGIDRGEDRRSLAAGAVGTPVILQRSAQLLGAMPHAVGRYFSPNGERRQHGGARRGGVARRARPAPRDGRAPTRRIQIGKPIASMTLGLPRRAGCREFERYSLQQIYFPHDSATSSPRRATPARPPWFGVEKKELTPRWRSWLTSSR